MNTPLLSLTALAFLFSPIPQDSGPPTPATQEPAAQQEGETSPFVPDENLRALLENQNPDAPPEFEVLQERPPLPAMRLRGMLRMKGATGYAALIELDGIGSFTRHEGERLSFTLRGARVLTVPPSAPSASSAPATGSATAPRAVIMDQPIVLRIVRIDTDGVLAEVGSLGQFLVIR